jgi:hypothetical protein
VLFQDNLFDKLPWVQDKKTMRVREQKSSSLSALDTLTPENLPACQYKRSAFKSIYRKLLSKRDVLPDLLLFLFIVPYCAYTNFTNPWLPYAVLSWFLWNGVRIYKVKAQIEISESRELALRVAALAPLIFVFGVMLSLISLENQLIGTDLGLNFPIPHTMSWEAGNDMRLPSPDGFYHKEDAFIDIGTGYDFTKIDIHYDSSRLISHQGQMIIDSSPTVGNVGEPCDLNTINLSGQPSSGRITLTDQGIIHMGLYKGRHMVDIQAPGTGTFCGATRMIIDDQTMHQIAFAAAAHRNATSESRLLGLNQADQEFRR